MTPRAEEGRGAGKMQVTGSDFSRFSTELIAWYGASSVKFRQVPQAGRLKLSDIQLSSFMHKQLSADLSQESSGLQGSTN